MKRLSEREKMYGFMLLFPLFWPFIPVVALCDVCEVLGNKLRYKVAMYRARRRDEL